MTPANATQDRYAPVWERLRVWRGLALKAAGQTPEHLSRAQVEPMLRWIFVLEFILRRLVLIAAAALTIRLPQKSTRVTPTLSRRAVTTVRATATAFRLYAHTRRPPAHAAHVTARPQTIRTNARPHHPPTPRYPLPVDALLRTGQHDLPDRAESPAQDDTPPPQPPAPKHAAIYAAKPLIARVAHLAQLIAAPNQLIARAARAFARNREIAARLAYHRPPRARGVLRTMPRLIADILAPLNDALSDILFSYAHANTS